MVVVERGAATSGGRTTFLAGALVPLVAAGVALIGGLEIAAAHFRFRGPTVNLAREFAYGPKHGPVLWAALALATVGLTKQERIRCLAAAAILDTVFFAARLATGTRPTFGNGALIVVTFLGIWSATRWTGARRAEALKGVIIGFTLVFAIKASDAWLRITALTQHQVLDQYVALADRSLGDPAWVVGRLVLATGDVGHLILQTVYIELPVAAIVVAVYQLRRGWPSHHIVRTFIAIGVVGPICYLLFPVVGPVFAYGTLGKGYALSHLWPEVATYDFRPVAFAFDGITPRNCMPSLHTAWAVTIFIHTRQTNRWLEGFGSFWLVGTLLATLGFGYHYGVDLIAGAVFALTVESALRQPERGWGWWRVRLVLGGSGALFCLLMAYRFLAVPIAELSVVTGPLLISVVVAMAMSFHATFFGPATAPAGVPAGRGSRAAADDPGLHATS